MPLLLIACPRCRHDGYIGADRVPGILRCSACGVAGLVREAFAGSAHKSRRPWKRKTSPDRHGRSGRGPRAASVCSFRANRERGSGRLLPNSAEMMPREDLFLGAQPDQ